MSTWVPGVLLLIAFVILYLPDILFLGPTGLHFIRQSDSLSFASNFHRYTWNPLAPQVFDLVNNPDNGRAAAEFPVTYYLAALFYQVLGERFFILRGIHLLIVAVGHYLFARALARWFGSQILGAVLSLWFFSSTIVIYYACNFLPDAASYGLVLSGWSLFFMGFPDRPHRGTVQAMILFALAAAIKAPTGIHLLGLLLLILASPWIGELARSFPRTQRTRLLIPGVLLLLMAASWHLFAINYNARYHAHYFMTWAEPIWRMSRTDIRETWQMVMGSWWSKYHYPTTWHVILGLAISAVAFRKHVPPMLAFITMMLVMGGGAFVALFFNKLNDHDYYFLTVAPVLAFVAVAGLTALRARFPKLMKTRVATVLIAMLAVLSLNYGKVNLTRRYAPSSDRFARTSALLIDLPSEMGKHSIAQGSRFIVLGDSTPNGALLYLGHKGWAFPGVGSGAPDLVELKKAGADHLLIIGDIDAPKSAGRIVHRADNWMIVDLLDEDQ